MQDWPGSSDCSPRASGRRCTHARGTSLAVSIKSRVTGPAAVIALQPVDPSPDRCSAARAAGPAAGVDIGTVISIARRVDAACAALVSLPAGPAAWARRQPDRRRIEHRAVQVGIAADDQLQSVIPSHIDDVAGRQCQVALQVEGRDARVVRNRVGRTVKIARATVDGSRVCVDREHVAGQRGPHGCKQRSGEQPCETETLHCS